MIYQVSMTIVGTTVPARIDGQFDGKPVSYLVMPRERMRVSFDVIEHPAWRRYGYSYRTTYISKDGCVLGGFDQTVFVPPDMLAEAHHTSVPQLPDK